MVSFTAATLFSLATVGALASPKGMWHHQGSCLSKSEAQQVATNYGNLIAEYSDALANAALTKDFTDYSESVNTLINTCPQGSAAVSLPLLSPTFSSRAQFEKGQGQQAPINFNQLDIQYNCNTVTLRWETTNTAPIPNPRPVVGIILLIVEKAPSGSEYPWLIKEVFSEFDSGAWLQNLEQAGICSESVASSPPVPYTSGAAASTYAAATTTAYASSYASASASPYASAAAYSSSSYAASYSTSSYAAGYSSSSYAASGSAYGSATPSSSWAASSSTAAAYSTSSYTA